MAGLTIVSNWAAFSSDVLSDDEKAAVRGYCGYPPYGAGNSGFQGWRFFQAYGTLEFRMNNLAPAEYQEVRGRVTEIQTLDAAVPQAGANIDTDEAGPWKHNKNEVADRQKLYRLRRMELCRALGIDPGPAMGSSNSMSMVI